MIKNNDNNSNNNNHKHNNDHDNDNNKSNDNNNIKKKKKNGYVYLEPLALQEKAIKMPHLISLYFKYKKQLSQLSQLSLSLHNFMIFANFILEGYNQQLSIRAVTEALQQRMKHAPEHDKNTNSSNLERWMKCPRSGIMTKTQTFITYNHRSSMPQSRTNY